MCVFQDFGYLLSFYLFTREWFTLWREGKYVGLEGREYTLDGICEMVDAVQQANKEVRKHVESCMCAGCASVNRILDKWERPITKQEAGNGKGTDT